MTLAKHELEIASHVWPYILEALEENSKAYSLIENFILNDRCQYEAKGTATLHKKLQTALHSRLEKLEQESKYLRLVLEHSENLCKEYKV